jgi:ubiquinone/menaquinone biosynthesis C-methylase UbiE
VRSILLCVAAACGLAACAAAAESEADRLAALLGLAPGMTLAEIGAGEGEMAIEMARRVGPEGRVYATELGEKKLDEIRAAAAEAGVANVEVLPAEIEGTGLPDGCCAAVFMRHVYHHLSDPAAVNRDLLRTLAPGARLVVVDFPPTWYLAPFAPEGVGEERTGHGITADAALRELESAGFEKVEVIADWDAHWFGPDGYALVLRKPAAEAR